MNKKVIAHFHSVDPLLASVIPLIKPFRLEISDDPFSDLVESIICQQLSDKAGATIFARFQTLFPNKKISARAILKLPDKNIRAVGPSWSKVSYIKNVAKAGLNFQALQSLDDTQIIQELTKIKGIGPWTAEMFLMFSLGRPDVFSFGDLGLRRAIRKLYNLRKEPKRKRLVQISKKWSPYRSYAARILWRSLEL